MSRRRSNRRRLTQSKVQEAVSLQETELQSLRWQVEQLTESAAELERQLAQDDEGWLRLSGETGRELSRDALRKISELARWMYIKNPLIKRGVNVQALYVFGQGMSVRAVDEQVNQVAQAFLDDSKNQAELTGHQARVSKEVELQIAGNLFFAFFTNRATGRVRVRTICADEVDGVVCNPEDAKEPWFYLRGWQQTDLEGVSAPQRAAYPDWRYRPTGTRPDSVRNYPVRWDTPVYHVKVGGLPDMRFGISEVYAAIDWAKAYKSFLEDWATIVRAYARFAWQLKTPGGRAGVAAARHRLSTTLGNVGGETNPPPVAGSTFIGAQGVDMQPIRTAGATTSAEDGRRLLLMVAAAVGLPETFFGDTQVGSLATAKSLDRPTELQMRNRQELWKEIFQAILAYVVEQSVRAPQGVLKGRVVEEDDGTPQVILDQVEDPETGELGERDATITVGFPPLLEHDVQARVAAIAQAATLGAPGTPAGTISEETLARLLLTTLGVEDVDAELDILFPPDEEAETAEPTMTEAVREMREALRGFVEKCQHAA